MPINFTLVDTTTIVVGKRNSGKSHLLKHIVKKEIDKFYKIFVICPTEAVNHFYSDIVDSKNIYPEYDESWIMKLIEKLTIEKSKSSTPKRILLILDDLVADKNFATSKTLKMLFVRGRHIHASILMTSQYLNAIPSIARSNADYVLAGQMNTYSTEILSENFLFGGMTKDQFMKMIHKSTTNYNFLLINTSSVKDNDKLEDIYEIIRVGKEE